MTDPTTPTDARAIAEEVLAFEERGGARSFADMDKWRVLQQSYPVLARAYLALEKGLREITADCPWCREPITEHDGVEMWACLRAARVNDPPTPGEAPWDNLPESKPEPTIFHSQDDLLLALMKVHKIERWGVDPTYSTGGFYKSGKIPQPKWKFDISPRAEGVIKADCRDLPLLDDSESSILCDLPFIHAGGKDSIIGNRFDSYPSQKELQELYWGALREFKRILTPGGILVFKCQDIVESGKQVWTHCHVWYHAVISLDYYAKDLAILAAKRRITGHNHSKQQHLRRFHSYFWALQKKR